MHYHKEQKSLPYSPLQIYDIVADIKSYPEFLPWIVAARILSENDNEITAELVIRFKTITSKYTSHVQLEKPKSSDDGGKITVRLIEGPFKYLSNEWIFIPQDGGCIVDFTVDFAFHSTMLEKIIGKLFSKAINKMTLSFEDRAKKLHSTTRHSHSK